MRWGRGRVEGKDVLKILLKKLWLRAYFNTYCWEPSSQASSTPLPNPLGLLSETRAWGLNTYGSGWWILLSSKAVNSDRHKSASAQLHPRHARVHIKVLVSRLKYGCICSLLLGQSAGDATLSGMVYGAGQGGQNTVASYHPSPGAWQL